MTSCHKSYAKINIFLKLIRRDDKFHFLISRFFKIDSLYDELFFTPVIKSPIKDNFQIIGNNLPCSTKDNLIYKLYLKLLQTQYEKKIKEFFNNYNLHINKNIKVFAGLGGGSSNVATFLKMINQELSLKLNIDDMLFLCDDIGSDIAFFLYDFKIANVFGKGEIIKEHKEEIKNINIKMTKELCKTPKIYKEFKDNFSLSNEKEVEKTLLIQNSNNILKNYNNIFLNDLYQPAINLHPNLKQYAKNGYFLSGSGSSVFK
jgi:4-diphosphocytidyl-2-C-methyl-D-erythritol kinase